MVLEADDEVIGLAHNDHVASGHSAVAGWRPSSTYFCDPPLALGFSLGQLANRRVAGSALAVTAQANLIMP
jgi:hypothetical protein